MQNGAYLNSKQTMGNRSSRTAGLPVNEGTTTLEMQDPKDFSIARTLKVETGGVEPSSTQEDLQDPKDVSTASTLKVEKDGVDPSSTQVYYLLRINGGPKASEKEGRIDEPSWTKDGNLPLEDGHSQTAKEKETIASGKRKYSVGAR
jgi:hypothetical protein